MTARAAWLTLALGAMLALAHTRSAAALGDTEVKADTCSVAAAGDAKNNTVNCTFGLTPEQVKQLTEAAARGATGPLTTTIVDLSKRLGVTEDATKTLLRIVGEQDVPLERLSETLNRVARDYKRLQMQATALNSNDPAVGGLVEQAKAKITAGDLEEAHRLLTEATMRQITAARQAKVLQQQAKAAEEADLIGAAASAATEGDLALTEQHYEQAVNLFKQSAELIPPGHPNETAGYLEREADALSRQGDEFGDNAALGQSIALHKDALNVYTRERVPLNWAATQNNLGNALLRLGEREAGTSRLDEAVAAYREALKEYTRERAPLDWATTQNNLGDALARLGEREGGTARLDEAVAAYREALKEYTRERAPLAWATTQSNLGSALGMLGQREADTARLDEAVAAFREALKENTRERVPLEWAGTQSNLGIALGILGQREAGTARLDAAVAAFREALEELTRERVPLYWAICFGNEGIALMHLAERRKDAALAETALNQLTTASHALRDGGYASAANTYEAQLSTARAVVAQLRAQ